MNSLQPVPAPDATLFAPERASFIEDHADLDALLRDVLTVAGDAVKAALACKVFDERVRAHLDAEDRDLLPALLRSNARAARAIAAEHQHLRTRLDELRRATGGRGLRQEALHSLLAELQAHARHEEAVLYPESRRPGER